MNQPPFKVKVLACILLHNICIEKEDSISRKLDLSYVKNGNARNSPEELRKILRMLSSKFYVDT